MSESVRPRCSQDSTDRGEPQAGSAPVAAVWLLVEHPGPWAPAVKDTAPLAGGVGAELEELVGAAAGSLLLVRRASSTHWVPGSEYAWLAVNTVRDTSIHGTWTSPHDLLAVAGGLTEALASGTEPADPIVAVCTHGVRDVCCATTGRPVARALTEKFGDAVWECSHLGGHRFAPTMLALPSGSCYGRLDPETAIDVVDGERAGLVQGEHLRGVTRFEPPVQAALAALLTAHGPAPLTDVTLASAHRRGEDTLVEFAGRGRLPDRTVVRVTSEDQPPRPLGCDAAPKGSTLYRATITNTEPTPT